MDGLSNSFSALAPVDYVGLGLVGILIVVGIWRGLWWQVIRLLGIVLAIAAARVFSPEAAAWIGESWPELSLRLAYGAAWLGIFLLTLGAASILGMLGQRIIEAIHLGFVNRVFGGIAGAATGLLVHLALLVVLVQLAPQTFVENHLAGTVSERLIETTSKQWRVVLGAEAADEVDRLLKGGPGGNRPEVR